MKNKVYRMMYYLKNQSKLFSAPKVFETHSFEEFREAFFKAAKYGYEVVDVSTSFED